jgi:hypothetical protein
MKQICLAAALLVLFGLPAQAADRISGAWTTETTGTGQYTQTFVFKVRGDSLVGVVCGPCDDPAAVFPIEDGTVADEETLTFFISDDRGRRHVTGTMVSRNRFSLRTQREGGSEAPSTTTLKRVVEDFELSPAASPAAAQSGRSSESSRSPFEGKWVAKGRVNQQNVILKVAGDTVSGLICGPCDPGGVFLIDDGRIDGNTIIFYINHMDTPVSADRQGVQRNVMRGILTGNVIDFQWVREASPDQPGGEMTFIGPIAVEDRR